MGGVIRKLQVCCGNTKRQEENETQYFFVYSIKGGCFLLGKGKTGEINKKRKKEKTKKIKKKKSPNVRWTVSRKAE